MAERARRHPGKIAEGTKANLRSTGEHATAAEERSSRQPHRLNEFQIQGGNSSNFGSFLINLIT
jgi:hypothetical protein